MNNCVNSIGFMFNSAKTYIKKDKNKKSPKGDFGFTSERENLLSKGVFLTSFLKA